MARRVTGNARRAVEILLVDGVHHRDHLPRPLDPRRLRGKGGLVERRVRRVAERAVIPHGAGESPHYFEERVHGNAAQQLDGLEGFFHQDEPLADWVCVPLHYVADSAWAPWGDAARKPPAATRHTTVTAVAQANTRLAPTVIGAPPYEVSGVRYRVSEGYRFQGYLLTRGAYRNQRPTQPPIAGV